jgi:hypothetical protein
MMVKAIEIRDRNTFILDIAIRTAWANEGPALPSAPRGLGVGPRHPGRDGGAQRLRAARCAVAMIKPRLHPTRDAILA